MAIKILIFTKRLPSLSPAEFRDYYENHHMPLIRRISGGETAFVSHTRNYIPRDPTSNTAQLIMGGKDLDFDCMVEVVYRDQEHLQAQMVRMGTEENARLREEDEHRFIERGSVRVVMVESVGDN